MCSCVCQFFVNKILCERTVSLKNRNQLPAFLLFLSIVYLILYVRRVKLDEFSNKCLDKCFGEQSRGNDSLLCIKGTFIKAQNLADKHHKIVIATISTMADWKICYFLFAIISITVIHWGLRGLSASRCCPHAHTQSSP